MTTTQNRETKHTETRKLQTQAIKRQRQHHIRPLGHARWQNGGAYFNSTLQCWTCPSFGLLAILPPPSLASCHCHWRASQVSTATPAAMTSAKRPCLPPQAPRAPRPHRRSPLLSLSRLPVRGTKFEHAQPGVRSHLQLRCRVPPWFNDPHQQHQQTSWIEHKTQKCQHLQEMHHKSQSTICWANLKQQKRKLHKTGFRIYKLSWPWTRYNSTTSATNLQLELTHGAWMGMERMDGREVNDGGINNKFEN